MPKFYSIAAVTLAIVACGPIKEVVTKEVITETVTVTDTVQLVDTLIIEKDKLRIELLRLPGDTVIVNAQCAADTIQVPVTVYKFNEKALNRQKGWTKSLFLIMLVLVVVILLRR